jgi:uncharacterized protein (TIGR00369 family)
LSDPSADPFASYDDDPTAPGWKVWRQAGRARFNAFLEPYHVRLEDGIARVRITPRPEHANTHDAIHGGALLGFMDVALFAAARGFGALGAGGGVTLDLSAQFIGAGNLALPLEARVELLRETGRMLFMRGLIVQEGAPTVASFTGTLRKATPRPA